MPIKKYTAVKNNTITNAFKPGLVTRGTGSNMGKADTSAVFEIYAQQSTDSVEKSRALYQFPFDTILSDRQSGAIPVSGSVSFYLRLFNIKATSTVPDNVTYEVAALSRSWEEGVGTDADTYADAGISNWIFAVSDKTYASASITVRDYSQAASATPYVQLTGSNVNYEFLAIDTDCGTSCPADQFDSEGSNNETATNLAALINTSASADFNANAVGAIVYITASGGVDGNNYAITSSVAAWGDVTGSQYSPLPLGYAVPASASLLGGLEGTAWTTEGGDWHTDTSSSFAVALTDGLVNFEVDISSLAEQWLSSSDNSKAAFDMGAKDNYGLIVKLSGAFESGANGRTYYQKKFGNRGTEFFFKKPVIEARWDDTVSDDRGKFFLSSSLAPAADNLMTLYLYNFIDGQLSNIPVAGTGTILLSVYSGTLDNSTPTGSKLNLPIGGDVVASGDTDITGGYVKTGIYSASFAYSNKFAAGYDSNAANITTIFPVWHTGAVGELYTGSAVTLRTRKNLFNYNIPSYRFSIVNLKPSYFREESAIIRVFPQDRNRDINIYTVANTNPEPKIIENLFYKIVRVSDETIAVNYSTGSLAYSKASYDNSGSYFAFDMSNLEPDYMYEVSFLYQHAGSYMEAREKFKFRVEG